MSRDKDLENLRERVKTLLNRASALESENNKLRDEVRKVAQDLLHLQTSTGGDA